MIERRLDRGALGAPIRWSHLGRRDEKVRDEARRWRHPEHSPEVDGEPWPVVEGLAYEPSGPCLPVVVLVVAVPRLEP